MTTTAFDAEQFARPYPDGIQHHYWNLARNALVLRTLREQLSNPGDLVFDVGCGRGITIEYLRRHGIQAIGADTGEPVPILPEVASYLYLGQDALTLPADLRRQVRILLLLDVLEHLPEPAAFVTALAGAFPSCRDLVVTVPARHELWSNYDEYYGHYRRFDMTSAETLVPPALFKTTSRRYLFRLLYPPALMLALAKAGRPVSIAAPSKVLRPLHRIMARYFQLESSLLPRSVWGTSLMLTLRRPPAARPS